MDALVRLWRWVASEKARLAEFVGLLLITVGIHEIYAPAALVFAGGALAFAAQGMERRE